MKNQIFDWNRFVAALRKEVVENWRTLLFSAIGIYGLMAIIMILGNLALGNSSSKPEIMIRYNFVYILYGFTSIIFASFAFRGLKSKTGRIELLTSPSSTFEKFLVNFTVYVLGFIVVFPICTQLADLTRIAVLWPWMGSENVPGPINYLSTIHQFAQQQELWPANVKTGMEVALWIGLLAAPGLYFLGSIVWPRLSFLKTFAAVYAIECVLSIVAMVCIFVFCDMKGFALWILEQLSNGTFMLIFVALMIFQLILYWGLSWWLWKRKDVISLKWWS